MSEMTRGRIHRVYHPAHGGAPAIGAPVPNAPADQPSFASAPRRRADPAPSRWAYRLTRLMLTPLFRAMLWLGVPVLAIASVLGGYLADEVRRDHIVTTLTELREAIETRPEFMVQVMKIEGASADVARDIQDVLALDLPTSSFELGLDVLREKLLALDPVAQAQIRVQPGGTLLIQVTERVPALIWRSVQGLLVLDAGGNRVGPLGQRGARPDLPVIAGEGADVATGEALEILAASGPLRTRMRGLVRVGERRWDVALSGDQRILLPAENPVAALERVMAMDAAMDVLSRDVAVVDLRLGHRPTLRLRENAVEELRRIRAIEHEAGAE